MNFIKIKTIDSISSEIETYINIDHIIAIKKYIEDTIYFLIITKKETFLTKEPINRLFNNLTILKVGA